MRFADRIRKLLGMEVIHDADWDDLTDLLIEGDLGVAFAEASVSELKSHCLKTGIRSGDLARRALKTILAPYAQEVSIAPVPGGLNTVLLLGVNGVGKTTTIAKLAHRWKNHPAAGQIVLAAGDTFRAAAIEQLRHHGKVLGLRVVAQERGADPGAVLFDAIDAASSFPAAMILADTAGRMHTKQNLLRELEKLDKIVSNKADPGRYRKLLVVDATTGQNAIRQAEAFSQAVRIDGLVLTKYDSSARGGIALSIAREFSIPCAFICDGERYESIKPFCASSYLDEFLGLE
jgi:fused signal recognition particle receptor